MYRLLLINDQPIFRDIIRAMLDKAGGFAVVAEREDGADAGDTLQELLPDAVVMDVQMPKMNGLKAVSTILKIDPLAVVVLTSMKQDCEYESLAQEAGGRSVLPEIQSRHRSSSQRYREASPGGFGRLVALGLPLRCANAEPITTSIAPTYSSPPIDSPSIHQLNNTPNIGWLNDRTVTLEGKYRFRSHVCPIKPSPAINTPV